MTRAVNLASLADSNVFVVDSGDQRVGVGSTQPSSKLDVNGTITATSYAGNFTGSISGTTGSFSGDVSIGGTLTYEDVTNVDSVGIITAREGIISTGIITATEYDIGSSPNQFNSSGLIVGINTSNDTRIQSVGEKTTLINGNTANLVYDTGGGNIAICTNATGDITLAVSGIPVTSDFDNNSLTFSVCSLNTGAARSCTAVTLNGHPATIRWAGGSLFEATAGVTTITGMDIYSFSGINTVGSASTTANYYLLGVVNGGYR